MTNIKLVHIPAGFGCEEKQMAVMVIREEHAKWVLEESGSLSECLRCAHTMGAGNWHICDAEEGRHFIGQSVNDPDWPYPHRQYRADGSTVFVK